MLIWTGQWCILFRILISNYQINIIFKRLMKGRVPLRLLCQVKLPFQRPEGALPGTGTREISITVLHAPLPTLCACCTAVRSPLFPGAWRSRQTRSTKMKQGPTGPWSSGRDWLFPEHSFEIRARSSKRASKKKFFKKNTWDRFNNRSYFTQQQSHTINLKTNFFLPGH